MSKKSKNPPYFVILEILDPDINALLIGLRHAFDCSERALDVHITLRGPYYSRIPKADLFRFEKIVCQDPITIQGIDVFQNETENIVYIGAHSDSLKQVWWKRDFPFKDFGFHPHISLHKTPDLTFAKTISDFLRKENIKLTCNDFRLTIYTSKQQNLFPADSHPQGKCFQRLSDLGLVHSDILHRATELVEKYRTEFISNKDKGSGTRVDDSTRLIRKRTLPSEHEII